jgi:HK97 family phage prohead protease
MSRIIHKSDLSLQLAAATDFQFKVGAEGVIEGFASTFGGEPDLHRDIIAPGAFAKSLVDHRQNGTLPAMLWAHKHDEPVGKWTAMQEETKGLRVVGALNLKTARGRDAREHVKAGDATGFSIGFQVPAGGAEYLKDGVTLLKQITLREVSIVAVPANRGARITHAKSVNSKGELVDLLREIGLPKAAAARVAAGGWPALAGADQQKAIDLAAQIEAATAKIRSL